MTHAKRFHAILAAAVLLTACVLVSSCTSQRSERGDRTAWFVHATDPHRYLYTAEDATDAVKKSTAFQESHDREVLSGFFQRVGTLPQTSGPPAFILITGDFGVDPCLIPNADTLKKPEKTRTLDDCVNKFDTKKRDDEVEDFSALFSASPVRNIYLVAGNNDLPLETADDAGIAYFNQFFQDVQSKISAKNIDVRLHNLTGCYGSKGGAISDCSPDIPGTAYRMIGFPSYSFKNKEPGREKNPGLQAAQFTTFRDLFDQAIKDGKKVIIATHVPEIDNPYYLARDRYDGIKPDPSIDKDKDNPRSPYSTWNVQKSLLDEWTKAVASDSVVAVLAGHLHDGHKEIYRRPYSWSTLKDHQMGFRKLFLTPPLSVKNQDGSPIQARGFTVVTLGHEHVSNRFYWYDGSTDTFNLEAQPEPESNEGLHRSHGRRAWEWFLWIWDLDESNSRIERMATLLIALLTAFLTVVAIWQIPPPDDPLAKKPTSANSKDAYSNSQGAGSSGNSSPFTTRFGATVLAGLGGLVVAEVTKSLGSATPGAETKWFYLVWFIFFFFFLLLSLNLLRALAEALRSRVAVIYYPLPRARGGRNGKSENWIHYWVVTRFVRWIGSLRVPVLTFFDTFINLIQGKNQTNSQAFTDAIIDQQRNVIRVSDAVRMSLHGLILSKIMCDKETQGPNATEGETAPNKPLPESGKRAVGTVVNREVRVNVSVLSVDQSNVFYISRSPRSARSAFTKISVAWVSVFTGLNRWYEHGYPKEKILLYDNSGKTIPDAPEKIMLDAYYEDRHEDYQAFAVLPLPQPRRALESKYVKGAIHISFSSKDDFEKIWPKAGGFVTPLAPVALVGVTPDAPGQSAGSTPATKPIPYSEPDHMLDDWCPDDQIRTALNDAIAVLGELLHGFNEVIYKTYIQPNQSD